LVMSSSTFLCNNCIILTTILTLWLQTSSADKDITVQQALTSMQAARSTLDQLKDTTKERAIALYVANAEAVLRDLINVTDKLSKMNPQTRLQSSEADLVTRLHQAMG